MEEKRDWSVNGFLVASFGFGGRLVIIEMSFRGIGLLLTCHTNSIELYFLVVSHSLTIRTTFLLVMHHLSWFANIEHHSFSGRLESTRVYFLAGLSSYKAERGKNIKSRCFSMIRLNPLWDYISIVRLEV